MKSKPDPNRKTLRRFVYGMAAYELVVLLLYAYFVRNDLNVRPGHVETYYPWFQDVNVMMLIGFGFLMTFVRTNSWGALGYTFFINAMVMQAYIIFRGFWQKVVNNGFSADPNIYMDITTLTNGSYCVAAILIALGALLGRITPAQVMLVSLSGCFFYALNERIIYDKLQVVDVGGSITIHTFGGYFGLAASLALGKKNPLGGVAATISYHSTMFSMFGTLFLWMFWPSFNSGCLPSDTSSSAQLRLWTITNTLLSLTGSCLSTFITSKFWRGKFHMEDVLNASLAGGVIIGAVSSLLSNPTGALIMGVFAGFISTYGFWKVSPWLSEKGGLIDVCGIHNLHAVPGFLGGVASAIVLGIASVVPPPLQLNPGSTLGYPQQAGMQIAGTILSFGLAAITGYLTGLLLTVFKNIPAWDFFEDKVFWDMTGHQGEKAHESNKPQQLNQTNENLGGQPKATHTQESFIEMVPQPHHKK